MAKHPLQPLVRDSSGVVRFHANEIVRHLLAFATAQGHGMNELAEMPFSQEYREQLAMLIGYSLCGFGDLSYVSDETYIEAEAQKVGE